MVKNFKTILNKNIINLVYSKENIGKFQEVMKNMESCLFVTSLSLSELLSNKTEVKNVIASSFFILDDFNNVLNRLLENLKYETYNDDIHIIIVSWLSTITLNEKIEIREIKYVNAYNNEKKIIIRGNTIVFEKKKSERKGSFSTFNYKS